MKSHTIKTICAVFAGMIIAGTAAFAQSSNYDDHTTLVLPKSNGSNLYLDAGFTYMYADDGIAGSETYYGGNVALGWRINKYNKIQVDVGLLTGDSNTTANVLIGNTWTPISVKTTSNQMPIMVSYSICIPLSSRLEFRLTPTAGLVLSKVKVKGYHMAVSYGNSDNDTVFAYGGGAGFTYHFNPSFYLDIGYRYLHVGATDYYFDVDVWDVGATNTHSVSANVGWKF